MDIKQRIEIAKTSLDRAKQAKTVAETQLQNAEKQVAEIEAQMKEYGVTPDTIQAEIDQLTSSINTELSAIEAAIPQT